MNDINSGKFSVLTIIVKKIEMLIIQSTINKTFRESKKSVSKICGTELIQTALHFAELLEVTLT